MAKPGPVVENKLFNPEAETMTRPALRTLQTKRLQETLNRVASVPFYRDGFARQGIGPQSIRTPDDIRRLPLTTKADLRDHYPLGFLAVSRDRVVRYHGSSGTTGQPTFVAYTRNDLEVWSELCARFLTAGGLRPYHTCQIAFGYGLFTGGFGLHQGIERVGAAIIPAASGQTRRQLMLMQDLKPEVLICTPSYALHIAETIREAGLDRGQLALQYAHFGGEPWTEDMRLAIEKDLSVVCFNNYGLSEVMGPGISGECAWRDGMHIQEDHFMVECLDPETLEPVPDGEPGELVFTTLTKEAFPLLRYRTRDMACLSREPCPCGRTTMRMSRVTGRTDDMLIIRGVNVFPSQFEEALLRVDEVAPHYLIEVDRPGALDRVSIRVEMRPETFSDRMIDMQRLRRRIAHEIHAITGVHVEINLVSPKTLERFAGKATRVKDHRILS